MFMNIFDGLQYEYCCNNTGVPLKSAFFRKAPREAPVVHACRAGAAPGVVALHAGSNDNESQQNRACCGSTPGVPFALR